MLFDKWAARRVEAQKTSSNRYYTDVRYEIDPSDYKKPVVYRVHAFCDKTGMWLGNFDIQAQQVTPTGLTPLGHHFMESILIALEVISPRKFTLSCC